MTSRKIAIAGTGYVGLSNGILLAQHNNEQSMSKLLLSPDPLTPMLYDVETKHINQAVKNNQDKFQEDFFFALTDNEFTILRSKDLTTNFSKTRINRKVFTEQDEEIRLNGLAA